MVDKKIFYNWVDTYADRLFHYANQRVDSSQSAEDLVQETFLAAWRNKDNYRGEASPKNWLYLILKSKIIDYYRSNSRKVHIQSLIDSPDEDDERDFFDEKGYWKEENKPQIWDNEVYEKIQSDEFIDVLKVCIKELKKIPQAAFTLKYLEEEEVDKICKTLGLTQNHFRVMMHRSKLTIRKCIEVNWLKLG